VTVALIQARFQHSWTPQLVTGPLSLHMQNTTSIEIYRAGMRAMLIGLLAGMLLAVPSFAQSAPARDTLRVDLQEALLRALETSPEVAAASERRNFAIARSNLANSSRFLTEFRATSVHSMVPAIDNPNNTLLDRLYLDPDVRDDWANPGLFNRLELEILQPIWTWGEISGSIRAARSGIGVEDAVLRNRQMEIAARTGELYYGLLLAQALQRLTNEAGSIVAQAKREVQRLIDEGDPGVTDADMFQVLITEQEYLRRVVEVEQRLATAVTGFQRQLMMPAGTIALPANAILEPVTFTPEPLEHYFLLALDNRPEMAQARAGLDAREALLEVARSNYYPKMFVGVNTRIQGAPNRYRQPNPYINDPYRGRGVQAGVGFRQELNFGQTRARVEQALAERNEVAFQFEAAEQLVLFQVEEAYRNFVIAQSAMERQAEALRISREWLRTEQINFDLDVGDTEYLIRAVRTNLDLQVGHLESIHRYNVAALRLLRAAGVLVD
jgi:outer membrane protein